VTQSFPTCANGWTAIEAARRLGSPPRVTEFFIWMYGTVRLLAVYGVGVDS
jgi:hypothetical protein